MLFSFTTRAGSPQRYTHIYYFFYLAYPWEQGHHNSMSQLLWAGVTYPSLSTFPVGGVPGELYDYTLFT